MTQKADQVVEAISATAQREVDALEADYIEQVKDAEAETAQAKAATVQAKAETARVQAEFDAYRASHPDTPVPPDPEPEPEPPADVRKICGMSAPANLWNQRVQEVGSVGLTARRIFAILTASATDQMDLVKQAHADGQMPIYSFKVPDIAKALAGEYDAWVKKDAALLAAFGKLTAVTFHHEPHTDMTPKQFTDLQARYAPMFQAYPLLRFGPLLNGWLLDKKVADFKSYMTPALMDIWDWVGIDTYQKETGSPIYPGDRIKPLLQVMKDFGHPDKPIAVGEYNGWDASAIAESGEVFLSTPSLWFFAMWNSGPTGLGTPLEGARLAAFKKTKADPRVRK